MAIQYIVNRVYGGDKVYQIFQDLNQVAKEVLDIPFAFEPIREVRMWDGDGDYINPRRGNDARFFDIIVGATPSETRHGGHSPGSMWNEDMQFNGTDYLFGPSGEGLLIIEPNHNLVVAELIGSYLYILFPLQHAKMSARSRNEVFKQILQETLRLKGMNIPTVQELFTGDFVIRTSSFLKKMRDADLGAHEAAEKAIKNWEAATERLKSNNKDGTSDSLLESLYRIPEVKQIAVVDGELQINTHLMYAKHPSRGTLHEFGEFRMTFRFGQDGFATFRNTTRRPEYRYEPYGHPHVDRAGHWCQGAGRAILPLLRSYEFEQSVLFAMKAIESVNSSREGNYLEVLERFPEVKERMTYPKKNEPLSDQLKKSFRKLAGNTITDTVEEARAQVRELEVRAKQELLRASRHAFISKIFEIADAKALTKLVKAECALLKERQDIHSITPKAMSLIVETNRLIGYDDDTGKGYRYGAFYITFDLQSGDVRYVASVPTIVRGAELYQAPHMQGSVGTVPLGSLALTIAELMGGLEIEAAVSMALEHLTHFKGKDVPRELMELLKAA